ncbi:MAG: hypothetical protein EP329_23260 [Deltaproteobacteria bacterium]|nr:MAG: hypothetical protein EP329_23260 [Deltaproteobacteria bacterium]
MTSTRWSIPLLALILLAGPGRAEAAECGSVGSVGLCRDTKTLVWCDDGELAEMVCPDNEICVADDRFGEGGAGCIATQYTDCGEITQAGECAGDDRAVVWCDANRVKARACETGTACAWVDDEGWFDCVALRMNATTQPEGGDDNGTETDVDVVDPPDTTDTPDTPDGETAGGPLPALEQGGAESVQTLASGGAGCAGGGAPAGVLGIFAGLALVLVRRRGASAPSGR